MTKLIGFSLAMLMSFSAFAASVCTIEADMCGFKGCNVDVSCDGKWVSINKSSEPTIELKSYLEKGYKLATQASYGSNGGNVWTLTK